MRLYLLDAFALIYRAYFALSKTPLVNSKGQNVSAISGFINTILELRTKEKPAPTHLVVAFDTPEPTFRDTLYPPYKAHREEMPEDIRTAIPHILNILNAMNIPVVQKDGFEADDIIGTMALKGAEAGFEVFMVTPDKDYGQLVRKGISIYKPAYLKNPREIMGEEEVCKKWDIEKTTQVVDLLGLMGDASDNIPGVKGVGEKTAAKLLREFGSMEAIYENLSKISGKMHDTITAGRNMAFISKQLATIITDVPIDFEPEKYVLQEPKRAELAAIFAELEFRTLGKRLLGDGYDINSSNKSNSNNATGSKESNGDGDTSTNTNTNANAGNNSNTFDLFSTQTNAPQEAVTDLFGETIQTTQNAANTPHQYLIAQTQEEREEVLNLLLNQNKVSFDTETTGIDAMQAELVGLSFAWQTGKAWYVPVPPIRNEAIALLEQFRPFFDAENIAKIGQNAKYDLLVLKNYGIEPRGVLHDTMLAHYLLEPDMRHNMNFLAETYLSYSPISIETLIGKKGKQQISMRQVALEKIAEYAAEDADVTWQLHQFFAPKLTESGLDKLCQTVETPLGRVLADMEFQGIAIDVPFLQTYSETLLADMVALTDNIYATAGEHFNIDSPKQLGHVLFDKLKIPYEGKKTATGQYSTDEEMLQKLAVQYPIAANLLDYRELTKLRSTYVDALPKLMNTRTGRVHTTYNQAVAATGRLSSTNPNLQNIPIRTERGREIRKAFVPRNQDYVLLAADYSQIELRLMAAMSGDPNMISAFVEGEDIHRATAAKVYGVLPENVDKEMRRKAKMVNFGIIYGITAFGLAQRLGIPRGEAAKIIDEYFKQYPAVKEYMNQSIETAREKGYAETLLGRRRHLRDIVSANKTVRQFAERNAINMPIQGSAADMIKMAMINIYDKLQKSGLQTKMLLQVHDELVFDVPKNEIEAAKALIAHEMIHALPLPHHVPVEVGIGIGENWLEAH